jgi:hypothetical protein
MEHIEIKTIVHDSPEYEAEVGLRYLILRQPLGLSIYARDKLLYNYVCLLLVLFSLYSR